MNKFIYILLVLFSVASFLAFDRLLEATGGQTAEGISIGGILFGVVVAIGFVLFCRSFSKSFRPFTAIILYFTFYLVFCICICPKSSFSDIVNNVIWGAMAFVGFTLGKKYYHYNQISRISGIISVTFCCLMALDIPKMIEKMDFVVVSDSYFLCAIILPCTLLMKSSIIKKLTMLFVLAMCILSFKRTVVIIALLTIILLLYRYFFYNKISLFWKISVLFLLSVVLANIISLDEDMINFIVKRFDDISEDGGSGRDEIYSVLLNDIIENFDLSEYLFGKGIGSVVQIVGINAHNDFLQIFHSFGLLGFLLCVSLSIIVIYNVVVYYRKMATLDDNLMLGSIIIVLDYILIGSFNCLFNNPPLITPLMFVLSYIMGCMDSKIWNDLNWNKMLSREIVYERE